MRGPPEDPRNFSSVNDGSECGRMRRVSLIRSGTRVIPGQRKTGDYNRTNMEYDVCVRAPGGERTRDKMSHESSCLRLSPVPLARSLARSLVRHVFYSSLPRAPITRFDHVRINFRSASIPISRSETRDRIPC